MNNPWMIRTRAAPLLLVFSLAASALASSLQKVSVADPSFGSPAGGDADSAVPIISADGRYVLFASAANNLAPAAGNAQIPAFPANVNVYLRDRARNTTRLVSVNLAGTAGGNNDSFPRGISTNGQYALFESAASDLVPGDTNNASNVFVRDIVNGVTCLVSANADGMSGNGDSRDSVMTPDGRYVAFVSSASDLVAGDSNNIPDVFVRDLVSTTTTLASIGATSASFSSSSESPAITPDGRYVAFFSTATNLVPGAGVAGGIYVRDLSAAATTWASTNAASIAKSVIGTTNVTCCNLRLSDDGNFVAFEACSTSRLGIILRHNRQTGLTDLVHTNSTVPQTSYEDIRTLDQTPDGRYITFVGAYGANTAVYLWDAQSGTNVLVSANTNNALSSAAWCDVPVVSSDGQYVAFISSATDLTTNTQAGSYHFYLRNVPAGTTWLVDADTNGVGSGVGWMAAPALTADGQTVAFESAAGNLASSHDNHCCDVFVADPAAGTMEVISAPHPALPSRAPNGLSILSSSGVSTNARFIAFTSDADDLVPGDTNQVADVFVRDLLTGTNILVSANTNGQAASGLSTEPSISGDGRYVAFTSSAYDLVPGVASNYRQVFVRDLISKTTVLVSKKPSGSAGNNSSFSPTISSDGRFVLFQSSATDLTTGSFSGGANLFLRDLNSGTNYALTANGVFSASMTPDGHYVAFATPSYPSYLYVWNSLTAARTYTNSVSPSAFSLSPDGHRLAYLTTDLKVADLVGRTVASVSQGSFNSHPGLRFSADARFLVYATRAKNAASDTNSTQDVYLYDFLAGTNLLVSRSFSSPGTPNDLSDSPDISPDGRFVAYRSCATNSIPDDFNGVPDLLLYDRAGGGTALVTVNSAGNAPANDRSMTPVFSADSQTLVFQSWASDLVSGDANNRKGIFALDISAFPALGAAGSGSTNSSAPVYAQLAPPGLAMPYPVINWPLAPGNTYRVQFKDDLNDPNWQDLTSGATFIGSTGRVSDLSASPRQRFYRIVLVPQ